MRTDAEIAETVRSAYADVRFEPSYERIVARAGRRRRFMVPIRIGVAVATTAAAFVVVLVVTPRIQAQRAAAWDGAFAEGCADLWSTLARPNEALPSELRYGPMPSASVFSFRDGEEGLRVSVSGPVLFECRRAGDGQLRGRIDPQFLPPFENELVFAATLDPSGGPEYIVGAVRVKADRVEARRADGTTVAGVLRDRLFVIWAPRQRLGGAEVAAYLGERLVASGRANQLLGAYDGDAFAAVCDTGRYLDPDRGLLPVPPIRFTLVHGDNWLRLYGDERAMVECERGPDGNVGVGTSAAPAKGRWRPLQYMAQLDRSGWVFGTAPAGTESVEVRLSDGRTVLAGLSGGFFAATWQGASTNVNVTKIVAYTKDTVYESAPGGQVNSHPR